MIKIVDFFTEDECDEILECYDKSQFLVGKMTKGDKEFINDDKNNLKMLKSSPYYIKALEIFKKCFEQNDKIKIFTSAHKYTLPEFLKYDAGMYYRHHIDYYEMSDVYTDYSCTIFLNDCSEYEGGELVIKVGDMEQIVKLKKGQAVLYNTGLYHEVKDVISGSRKCAVFWLESFIQDAEIRTINEGLLNYSFKYEDKLSDDMRKEMFSIQQQILRAFATRNRKSK